MKHFLGLCRYKDYNKLKEETIFAINLALDTFKVYDDIIDMKEEKIESLNKMIDAYKEYINIYSLLRINGEDIDFLEFVFNIGNQPEAIQC